MAKKCSGIQPWSCWLDPVQIHFYLDCDTSKYKWNFFHLYLSKKNNGIQRTTAKKWESSNSAFKIHKYDFVCKWIMNCISAGIQFALFFIVQIVWMVSEYGNRFDAKLTALKTSTQTADLNENWMINVRTAKKERQRKWHQKRMCMIFKSTHDKSLYIRGTKCVRVCAPYCIECSVWIIKIVLDMFFSFYFQHALKIGTAIINRRSRSHKFSAKRIEKLVRFHSIEF